jgi:hypothetical protein
VLGLTFYLDDSGSDVGSPLVTCGGLLMSRLDCTAFSGRLIKMYERHQKLPGPPLEPPLHMTDFTGMGKYAGWYPEFKRVLFRDVAKLINEHKLYSLSIAVSQIEFSEELSEDVRTGLIGSYAFAFFALVAAHQTLSEKQASGPLKTAYRVHRGFNHQDQLNQAHKLMVGFEEALGGFRHTGALATGSAHDVPPLQAADAIAWASRKMELDGKLPEGFEPLSESLREDTGNPHRTIAIPRDGVKMLAIPINNWISRRGTIPTLADIVLPPPPRSSG